MAVGGVVGEIVPAVPAPAHQIGLFDEHGTGARGAAGAAAGAVERLAGVGVGGRFVRAHEIGIERHGGHWRGSPAS